MADAEDLSEILKELGITEDDIYREAAAEIDSGLDDKAAEVAAYWPSVSPRDTGEYDADVQIKKMVDKRGRPVRRVGDYARHAHIIEYGSEHQDAHHVRANVATHFGNEGKYMVD